MKKLLCLFAFVLICLPLYAQSKDELGDQLKRSTMELNQLCKKLKAKLGPADKAAFIKSQQDWLRFRASNGRFKSLAGSQNIILSHITDISCQLEMTEARIREVQQAINDY